MELEQLSEIALDSQALALKEFGSKLYRQGRYEAAIKHYQRFLASQTGDIELYSNFSECWRNLNKIGAAIAILEQGIRHYPTAGQLHFKIIKICQQNARTQQAISSAETATKILPDEYVFKLFKHLTLPIVYDTSDEIKFYKERYVLELETLIQETSLNNP